MLQAAATAWRLKVGLQWAARLAEYLPKFGARALRRDLGDAAKIAAFAACLEIAAGPQQAQQAAQQQAQQAAQQQQQQQQQGQQVPWQPAAAAQPAVPHAAAPPLPPAAAQLGPAALGMEAPAPQPVAEGDWEPPDSPARERQVAPVAAALETGQGAGAVAPLPPWGQPAGPPSAEELLALLQRVEQLAR